VKLVKEVGVDADSGGDDEVADVRLAEQIVILNAAEGYAARGSVERGPGGGGYIHGQVEVVSQGVGRAHGENGKCDAGVRQHLDNIVNGAVAAAGEDGVTTGEDSLTRLFLSVGARLREDQLGIYVCVA
jgi:hypothetical protein